MTVRTVSHYDVLERIGERPDREVTARVPRR
jgi:hypothetical protein